MGEVELYGWLGLMKICFHAGVGVLCEGYLSKVGFLFFILFYFSKTEMEELHLVYRDR